MMIGTREHKILLDVMKKIRIDAGFRQIDLAKKLHVPQSRISKYELGERRVDFLELREICNALGTSLSDVLIIFEELLEKDNNASNSKTFK